MKKVVIFLLILLLIASPVTAFSVKDFLINFGEKFTGITGYAPIGCIEGNRECTDSTHYKICNEPIPGGFDWNTYLCGASTPFCLNGYCKECISGSTCGTDSDCIGSSCILECQSSQWVEVESCLYGCSNTICSQRGEQQSILLGGEDATIQMGCTPDDTKEGICFTGATGICNYGIKIKICDENRDWGDWGACTQDIYPGDQNEICDDEFGDDEDCNGLSNHNDPNCPAEPEIPTNPNEPQQVEGEESINEDLLNHAPTASPIRSQISKINTPFRFTINAIDLDDDPLSYSLKETSEKLTCSITRNNVECVGINAGKKTLEIIISDSIDEIKINVDIIILPDLPSSQEGIKAGVINNPPIADAGEDKTGFPGQPIILDASRSFDEEGLSPSDETYKWYENEKLLGKGKNIETTFSSGSYTVKLLVTDFEGETSEDTLTINIIPKEVCKSTTAKYFPTDTPCNTQWPTTEGETFTINSLTKGACGLFEVCSDKIEGPIEDSIKCCTDQEIDSNKVSACNFAKENGQTLKNCQAMYIIQSLGRDAIYMEGYFDAEMCCKGVDALCPSENYLYKAEPLPSWLKGKGLKCSNTPEDNPNGYWASNTKLNENEIALADLPASVNINKIHTGTCVDYSVSATTLLRKISYAKDEILTVEAPTHAYNLILFELDKKYTIFDTTGNNDGFELGKVPQGFDYCENILNCYNDAGKIPCPKNSQIHGCEGKKESTGRKAGRQVAGIKGTILSIWEKIWNEIIRQ